MLLLMTWHPHVNTVSFLSFHSYVNNIILYNLIFQCPCGTSIIACWQHGRNVIAYEGDVSICKEMFVQFRDKKQLPPLLQ